MTISGIRHITLVCQNAQRMLDFCTGHWAEGSSSRRSTSTIRAATTSTSGIMGGRPGSVITFFERDAAKTANMHMGYGQTHYFALPIADEETKLQWREKLPDAGPRVSPVTDRVYFRRIYTQDPDGYIGELATSDPGLTIEEAVEAPGQKLKLPEWLEPHREKIARGLRPLVISEWKGVYK